MAQAIGDMLLAWLHRLLVPAGFHTACPRATLTKHNLALGVAQLAALLAPPQARARDLCQRVPEPRCVARRHEAVPVHTQVLVQPQALQRCAHVGAALRRADRGEALHRGCSRERTLGRAALCEVTPGMRPVAAKCTQHLRRLACRAGSKHLHPFFTCSRRPTSRRLKV